MKITHKIRIKKRRLALLVGLIATAVIAGYKSMMSYPAEPVSVPYVISLSAGFGLLCFFAAFAGKERKRPHRTPLD